jgi:hypothetical protein
MNKQIASGLRMLLAGVFFTGCAQLHHVQLGDLDNTVKGREFSVKVSETGIDLEEAVQMGKFLTKSSQAQQDMGTVQAILALIQMGPRTGNPIYHEKYAEEIVGLLKKECPNGKISNLTAIRETRKYPVISGEIIKINGNCNS